MTAPADAAWRLGMQLVCGCAHPSPVPKLSIEQCSVCQKLLVDRATGEELIRRTLDVAGWAGVLGRLELQS